MIVAPAPSDRFNIGLCAERLRGGLWTWNAPPDCQIDVATYHIVAAAVIAMLKDVSRIYDVSIIWPSDYLCGPKNCPAFYDGVPLYRDDTHFSYAGSQTIFRTFGLFGKMLDAAR